MFFSNYFVSHQRFNELKKWLPLKCRKNVKMYIKRYHKPLAFITKTQPFLGHQIITRPPVLIPRPETEYWVGNLLSKIDKRANVLELCTGTGCIARALSSYCDRIVAIDKSPNAVGLARLNTRGLDNVQVLQTDVFKNDWIEQFRNSFDLIIANPPYIPQNSRLPLSVKLWEDKDALFGGPLGTDFHQRILEIAPMLLLPNKNNEHNVILEIDSRHIQKRHLEQILKDKKIEYYEFEKDQFGRNRVLKCLI